MHGIPPESSLYEWLCVSGQEQPMPSLPVLWLAGTDKNSPPTNTYLVLDDTEH